MKQKIYNNKAYFKERYASVDKTIQRLLNYERSGALEIPIMDYMLVAHELVDLGLTGEAILARIVKVGMSNKPVIEMRNLINGVEAMSIRLKAVAESKWGGELENFPVFKSSTATMGELLEQVKAVREMDEFLEEE